MTKWGYRAMEPNRCCVSPITLVLLKTGIAHHPPDAAGERQVIIDYNQMATAQKLYNLQVVIKRPVR